MHALFDPLPGDQFVKDGQDLFPILINTLQPSSHAELVAMPQEQFVQEFAGDVDVAAQGVGGVAPKKQAVE